MKATSIPRKENFKIINYRKSINKGIRKIPLRDS